MTAGSETPSGVTLVVGGARSGKSALAVEIGRLHDGPVVVIATATAADDVEMADRIARHRAERPDWPTVEEHHEVGLAALDAPADALVIVDCLTVWVSNMMWLGRTDDQILDAAEATARVLARRDAPSVVITNEVGMGVHPETALGRRYRDLLGHVNAAVATVADRTLLMVAGRALRLDDPWDLLS